MIDLVPPPLPPPRSCNKDELRKLIKKQDNIGKLAQLLQSEINEYVKPKNSGDNPIDISKEIHFKQIKKT